MADLQNIVHDLYPDRDWEEGVDDHPHYVTVLKSRQWRSHRIVLEVVLRGQVEVNIVDHRDEEFLYESSRIPSNDDETFREQVESMVEAALMEWGTRDVD